MINLFLTKTHLLFIEYLNTDKFLIVRTNENDTLAIIVPDNNNLSF